MENAGAEFARQVMLPEILGATDGRLLSDFVAHPPKGVQNR